MSGEATTGAAMTGNPYLIAAGVGLDILSGFKAAKAANKAARKQRDAMVRAQAYADRDANLAFSGELDASANYKMSAQIEALKKKSAAENVDSGIGGSTINRARQQYMDKLGRILSDVERSERLATVRHTQGMKAAHNGLSDRINQIQVTKFDPTQELISGGLKIRGDYVTAKSQHEKKKKDGEVAPDANYSFLQFLGL